ncbi:MAG: BON domain-containing protein [Planctomycetota bacterium]
MTEFLHEPARLEISMLTMRHVFRTCGLLLVCTFVADSSQSAYGQSFGTGGSGSSSSSTGSSSKTSSSTSSSSRTSSGTSGAGLTSTTPINRAVTSSGTNQASSTGFVGASSSENFVGGARQANQSQGRNRQFQAFQPSQNMQSSQSQQTGTSRSVRTSLRMAFPFPAAAVAQQSGALAPSNSLELSRFELDRPELTGINVNMSGTGEVILPGAVPSTEASRLAANLIRLQPGVRKVNNQLAVTP